MPEQILPLRLPPSGAEILDALSLQSLELGHGTPGLVWRSEYLSGNGGVDIGAQYATPVVIPNTGGAWALPAGYWYDLEFAANISSGAGPTVNNLVVLLEGSNDNGATWGVGIGVFVWSNTTLAANESATYGNGRLRYYVGTDITNVRVRAGASGNAGDRELWYCWLRAEQYTEGDEPENARLNPSGTFLNDATTLVPAQIGSGSPGLVWRAVTSAGTSIGGSTLQPLTGLTNLAWSMPAGYRYDFEFSGCLIDGAAGTAADLVITIEGSTNNGGTWGTIHTVTIPTATLAAGEAREYIAAALGYIPTVDITNVRVSAAGWAAARVLSVGWLKAEMYVQ